MGWLFGVLALAGLLRGCSGSDGLVVLGCCVVVVVWFGLIGLILADWLIEWFGLTCWIALLCLDWAGCLDLKTETAPLLLSRQRDLDHRAWGWMKAVCRSRFCAHDWIRTSTSSRTPPPQDGVSTDFTT